MCVSLVLDPLLKALTPKYHSIAKKPLLISAIGEHLTTVNRAFGDLLQHSQSNNVPHAKHTLTIAVTNKSNP